MSFQVHKKLLENENFSLKVDQYLEICESLLFTSVKAINSTKNNLRKYAQKSLKRIVQENS